MKNKISEAERRAILEAERREAEQAELDLEAGDDGGAVEDPPQTPPAPASPRIEPAVQLVPVPVPVAAGGDVQIKAPDRGVEALPFEPRNADDVWRLSQMLARSTIVPAHMRNNPANVFVVLMTGRDYGLRPFQSIAAMHVIDGKVGMSAQMIVALVLSSGRCEYFRCTDSTEARARYVCRRAGDPPDTERELAFTIEQAERAGLAGKQNWRNQPAVMLRWRAASQLARDAFPDVALGLYTLDELDEVAAAAPDSVRVGHGAGAAGLKAALAARGGGDDLPPAA